MKYCLTWTVCCGCEWYS